MQATLDEVAAEVETLEREGLLASPKPVDDRPEAAEIDEEAPARRRDAGRRQPRTPAPRRTPHDAGRDGHRPADQDRAHGRRQHDGHRSVRRPRVPARLPHHAAEGSRRRDRVDRRSDQKIDKTTKERFREAFAVINQNFEQTFTTLFGGGRAGLVLLDESDQLESGIDIIAQPPGKRLQNVQLLSGGEKALTAMALMFAIFKYRPSPFCLLDEIDAPLDDANIGRFVEMLQGMQEHTQFILITHNRKTMEIADRLWGVTMEEPGVSKLISVQLN